MTIKETKLIDIDRKINNRWEEKINQGQTNDSMDLVYTRYCLNQWNISETTEDRNINYIFISVVVIAVILLMRVIF